MIDPEKIIVALDLPEEKTAREIVHRLAPRGVAFKVGLQAYLQWGTPFVESLLDEGCRVFLDLKFHDIPNTIAGAVKAAAAMGVWMVNLHTASGSRAMAAAREALAGFASPPLLIGVTVLTSLAREDLVEMHLPEDPAAWAEHLALFARRTGLDGVVCSAMEVGNIRKVTGGDFVTVTPGIRLPSSQGDDQRRVVTPSDAIQRGSDYLVVGRPITRAEDPVSGLDAVLKG